MSSRPARGRPRKGPDPERHKEILDAAADVILRRGYDATSMQEIADAVELLKGSLYYYVKSKEDFLYQIVQPVYVAVLDGVRPIELLEVSPLEKLAVFAHTHIHFVIENMRAFRIRIREFSQLGPERKAELAHSGHEYYEVLRRILEAGVEAGDIDPQLDVRIATYAIVGQLNSLTQWYDVSGRSGPAELANQMTAQIVASVASDRAVRSGGLEMLRRRVRQD